MDIQHLRCKVNFEALIFVPHIRTLGDALISHLRYPDGSAGQMGYNDLQEVTGAGASKNAGKFVVLHLRFDKVLLFYILFITIEGCKISFPFTCFFYLGGKCKLSLHVPVLVCMCVNIMYISTYP